MLVHDHAATCPFVRQMTAGGRTVDLVHYVRQFPDGRWKAYDERGANGLTGIGATPDEACEALFERHVRIASSFDLTGVK